MAQAPKSQKARTTKKKKAGKLRYSFFTLLLLACLVYVGVGVFYNISKTINYQVKIKKMEQLKDQAAQDNVKLKEELDNFNSLESLEAIARNNLKMAGEDEVLVIINKKMEDQKKEEAASSAQQKTQKVVKHLEKKHHTKKQSKKD